MYRDEVQLLLPINTYYVASQLTTSGPLVNIYGPSFNGLRPLRHTKVFECPLNNTGCLIINQIICWKSPLNQLTIYGVDSPTFCDIFSITDPQFRPKHNKNCCTRLQLPYSSVVKDYTVLQLGNLVCSMHCVY